MGCGHRSTPRSPKQVLWSAAAALFLTAFACVAQQGQDAQPVPKPAQTASDAQAAPNPAAQPVVDAAKPQPGQNAALADDRKKQITSDSSQLLTMAIALKAEVDKTNKDTLSLNVIRKADQIEKLAHSVKEKIKLGPGPG
jgi:hypothetical protein